MIFKKICILTGTRAEYGQLKGLIELFVKSKNFKIKLIVTGSHLSSEFGSTYLQIQKDQLQIDKKIEILLSSDTQSGVVKSLNLLSLSLSDYFSNYKPDLLIILGDRYEVFAAAYTALIFEIPIAHIHGGEITEGAFDDAFRHSITKMSNIHFVANKVYKKRVVQLGESPKRVFVVGGLGVDTILKTKIIKKGELESKLNFSFGKKNLLVTYHPETIKYNKSENDIDELLLALNEFKDINLIFTMPNADTGNKNIINKIKKYVRERRNAKIFSSLGQENYYSTLKIVDGVIGNSSSGLAEVPTFKKGTINIGRRQKGRLKASSIIDCPATSLQIKRAIKKLYSREFQNILRFTQNPYGKGGATKAIFDKIKKMKDKKIIEKYFYDIKK